MPASFSKECYEDLLAFKSQLIAARTKRQAKEQAPAGSAIGLSLLALTEQGMPDPRKDEFDKKAFQANSRRLEQRLGSLGLLRRLSDGCAYVVNPYAA